MKREEAAQIIADEVRHIEKAIAQGACIYNPDGPGVEEYLEAERMAVLALRGPAWVKTSERLPTEADTGDDGKVLCVTTGVFGGTVILHVFWGIIVEHPERYPYWMPMPALPEQEDAE